MIFELGIGEVAVEAAQGTAHFVTRAPLEEMARPETGLVARALGLDPVSVPIRGGTDGSRLTEMGVPTPNLFTGMQNIHGPLEWISVQDMAVATNLCLTLAGLAGKQG